MSFYRYAALLGTACAASLVAGQAAHGQAMQPAPSISLEDAFARSLQDAPQLGAFDASRLAAEAAVRQADRPLNPTVGLQLENAVGTGLYSGLDRSETTVSYGQTLELGGDRAARVMLAQRQGKRVEAHGEIVRQDIMAEIALAYVEAQRAGAELAVAAERLEIAREVSRTVERRVAAARDPLLASSRTLTQVAEAEIAYEKASMADDAARRTLASYWGGAADFSVEPFAPAGEVLPAATGTTAPELEAAFAAEREADARIDVERAKARPDPTLTAGLRYFRDNSEAALVLGLSIPLTFRDNNSGAIARASAEAQRAKYETEALRRNLQRQINSTRSQMDIARAEIASVDERLLPSAEEAVMRARQGYEQGGFSYLDVLEAQRVLAGARLQRISALASYHRASVALTRLLGGFNAGAPL